MTIQNKDAKDDGCIKRPGYDALWGWFSLSYASWLTIPRVLMHEMPDDWQAKMADLLFEYNARFDLSKFGDLETCVSVKKDGKFHQIPPVLCNYRRPDKKFIRENMIKTAEKTK